MSGLTKIEDLPCYHDSLTRNTAEVLLITNGSEGSYLIRPSNSNPGNYAVSVRFKQSVKHISLCWDEEEEWFTFGMGEFETVEELVDHFNNLPVIGGESGPAVVLKHPYINEVEELRIYSEVQKHATLGREYKPGRTTSQPFDLTIASKEGFLTKKGAIIKNWRKRWFVVVKNVLMYYKKCGDKKPKRTLNLRDAIEVKREEKSQTGKSHCFRLVFQDRTFQMCAENEQDLQDWLRFLQWKIDHFKGIDN